MKLIRFSVFFNARRVHDELHVVESDQKVTKDEKNRAATLKRNL